MSRGYLDTNFVYGHLRATRGTGPEALESWRTRAISALGPDSGVISALVLDELAYRLVLAWLRDDGDPDPLSTYRRHATEVMHTMRRRLTAAWETVDALQLELHPTDQAVVDRARSLMARPGLAPRDAFHAAHALAAGCELIVSSDRGFDRVGGLHRLGPDRSDQL